MFSIRIYIIISVLALIFYGPIHAKCGCRRFTACYQKIEQELMDKDETMCIEEAAEGASTIIVLLNVLKHYCGDVLKLNVNSRTFEERNLYEVTIGDAGSEVKKPVILIEAGQDATSQPVSFALYIIQQLVGCEENKELVDKVKWVILPSTNPDGMEINRQNKLTWKKNAQISEDKRSYGVDITRNFGDNWDACEAVKSSLAVNYPGAAAFSEKESIFIKDTLEKHKSDIKVYVSLRGDGHGIFYPHAYSDKEASSANDLKDVAANVTSKVNLKAGAVQLFKNQSIFENNGKAHCGHSIDYASSIGLPLTYEMRVFLGNKAAIIKKFNVLPKGFDKSLRNGYFNGIKAFYEHVIQQQNSQRTF